MKNDWDYMRLRAGDEFAGRTQHRPMRFNWGSADREEFSEFAEQYVRAACVLLAQRMGDTAVEADVVSGRAAWDQALGGAACLRVAAKLSIVLRAMLEGAPPHEIASILLANVARG